ncbi:2-C-methyl-D-erythritol 4-phosphate cytidylyltransferase [Candidatus Latescibacterota bacterium]
MLKAYGIIAAGGSGKRMGADVPKQLLELERITIFERSLRPFLRCPDIEGIVVVAAAAFFVHINAVIENISDKATSISVVEGGAERQDSVRNGLEAVPEDVDVVVIHDAVRPFITAGLISECVRSAYDNGAVCVMRPLKETLKAVSGSVVRETLDRSTLWIAQTPQAFNKILLWEAHQHAVTKNITGTDDCMLVELLGKPVHIIEGSDMNIKITTPADLKIAAAVLAMFTELED